MSDTLHLPVLSSNAAGYGEESTQDGGIVLPQFWDGFMARYGHGPKPGEGWAFVSANLEGLMRHMMREPMLKVAYRVLVSLLCEGTWVITPAIAQDPGSHGNGKTQRDYKRSQQAHEFTEGWVSAMPRKIPEVGRAMCEAWPFGHKLAEIETEIRGAYVVPIDLSPKPRTAYRLKVDKSYRLLGAIPSGKSEQDADALIEAIHLLVLSVDGEDGSPVGTPALATAYKPWYRKESALKDQGASSKQSGGAFVAVEQDFPPANVNYEGTVKTGKDSSGNWIEEAAPAFNARQAARARTGTAVGLGPGAHIKVVQASAGDAFSGIIEDANREMVMCFLGQSRTLLSSDANSQADAKEASGVAATIRDEGRGALQSLFNELFERFVVLNLGEEYRAFSPKLEITTEETGDLVAVGNFLMGMFDRLSLEQKNYFMSLVGGPEFTEEQHEEILATDTQDESEIDANDQAGNTEEVAAFAATFPASAFAEFATRLEIANGAAQRRLGGQKGIVPSFHRQFRSLVTRLENGKLTEAEFVDRFSYTLSVGHDRAMALGWGHGGQTGEFSQEASEYLANVVLTESDFARELAESIVSGEKSLKQGLLAAKRYAQRMGGTANEAFRLSGVGSDLTYTWVLGGNEEHCAECPEYAAMDPQPADGLLTVPRAGQTPCRLNCLCHLERSDGREGFKPVSIG